MLRLYAHRDARGRRFPIRRLELHEEHLTRGPTVGVEDLHAGIQPVVMFNPLDDPLRRECLREGGARKVLELMRSRPSGHRTHSSAFSHSTPDADRAPVAVTADRAHGAGACALARGTSFPRLGGARSSVLACVPVPLLPRGRDDALADVARELLALQRAKGGTAVRRYRVLVGAVDARAHLDPVPAAIAPRQRSQLPLRCAVNGRLELMRKGSRVGTQT